MTTNIFSLADARAVRAERALNATPDPGPLGDHPAFSPWFRSKKGNPYFRFADHIFVALEPKWRGSSWKLWVKSPDGGTRTLPEDFASFGALQRGVVAFLAAASLAAG
jgi:hypothetical protein